MVEGVGDRGTTDIICCVVAGGGVVLACSLAGGTFWMCLSDDRWRIAENFCGFDLITSS